MSEETGPTRIVPGSHRGTQWPEASQRGAPLPGEVAAFADAGDAVLINTAVWHTGGRNPGSGLRRAVYLHYGWWWLKGYEVHQDLPWQVFVDASEQRLHLLGVKMPDPRFQMYEDDVPCAKN